MQTEFKSEARLTFTEAAGIIIGHGVGAGILSVPYLASRNTIRDFIWILLLAYGINLIMHLMIAELSYHNGGAQFITCLDRDLFHGKALPTWLALILIGVAEMVKVAGFITGAAAVFTEWLGLPAWAGMLLYYCAAAGVVYGGMKLVGICEKYCVYAMAAVVGILVAATLRNGTGSLPTEFYAPGNVMALYSMTAFALSAVMSVPQVVKGLNGDVKRIRGAIAAGTGVNAILIGVITLTTLWGTDCAVTENGALVDLSGRLGGWVSVIGYIFTLLALSTSFWACTLNLRDVFGEKSGLDRRVCWLMASLPCLLLALTGVSGFVGLTRISSAGTVILGLAVILAYGSARRRAGESPICGCMGSPVFMGIVIASTLTATVGSLISVV